jgi:hypothetical protein
MPQEQNNYCYGCDVYFGDGEVVRSLQDASFCMDCCCRSCVDEGDAAEPAPERDVPDPPFSVWDDEMRFIDIQGLHDVVFGNTNTTPSEESDEPQQAVSGRLTSSMELPSGWGWYESPHRASGGGKYAKLYWRAELTTAGYTEATAEVRPISERFESFRNWLNENNLIAHPVSSNNLYTDPSATRMVNVPSIFLVFTRSARSLVDVYPPYVFPEPIAECVRCSGEHPMFTQRCTATGEMLNCSSCGHSNAITREMGGYPYCTECGGECGECGALVPTGFAMCVSCTGDDGYFGLCGFCSETLVWTEGDWGSRMHATDSGIVCCATCWERVCRACERHSSEELNADGECTNCVNQREMSLGEEFDEQDLTAPQLQLPTIEGRENIRTCGIEIEGVYGSSHNANELARDLYNSNLSAYDAMGGYHTGLRGGFAHVERDGSVDWEMVVGPINMADRRDVQKLNKAVRLARGYVKDERYKLDLRCGCHIHVSAERVSLGGAFNLGVLWNYSEDAIFRLAAAKWPGHRAIRSDNYTRPLPKNFSGKVPFAREVENNRYYALSFENYFRQMLNSCSCGAVRYDSWSDCTCNLGKCTFEFRVFNSTVNARKLHAYLALTQALVAKALSLPEIEAPNEHFPAHGFVAKKFKDMSEAEQELSVEEWKERLTWMFTELPMTPDEKQSLRYCVVNSELVNVGDSFIETLVPTTEEVAA